jgi:hypothetical protein
MSVAGGPDMIQDGLVLSLDAADRNSYAGSGTAWLDLSGNGNNGTLTNGPTFSSANQGSIVFDGVDDYVTGSLSSPTVGCISMWINSNSLINSGSTGKTLIHLRWNGVNNSEWYVSVGSLTLLLVDEYITIADVANGERTAVADGGSLLANTWYNLTFNSEAGKYQIYVNAVPKTQIVAAGGVSTLTNGNRVAMAALVRAPEGVNSLFFDGRISNVQLYSGSLTTAQITQNYNSTKTRFGL